MASATSCNSESCSLIRWKRNFLLFKTHWWWFQCLLDCIVKTHFPVALLFILFKKVWHLLACIFFGWHAFPPKLKNCSLCSVYPIKYCSMILVIPATLLCSFPGSANQGKASRSTVFNVQIYPDSVCWQGDVAFPCSVIYDTLVASSAVLRWSSWENSLYLVIFFFPKVMLSSLEDITV